MDAVEAVALAHDAPQSLLEVGRSPRAVEVVDRGEARLNVRSGAERRGRAQQDADVAAADLLVQGLLLLRLALGVGHAGDLGLGDAGLDEAAAHVVLDVPAPGGGRGGVYEHELRAALGLGAPADVEDVPHACVDLAAGKRLHVGVFLEVEQLRVERDLPAVAGNLEHVVHARVAAGVDLLAALHQRLDLGELFGRRRDRNRVALELGEVEVEVVGGHDVAAAVERAHELGEVLEPREASLDIQAAALGLGLQGLGDLAEGLGPRAEVRDPLAGQQVRREVALHVVELGHRVRDGRARGEHDVVAAPVAAEVFALHQKVLALGGVAGLHARHRAARHREVLEVVGLVDEYRVAADLLERRALERLGGVFLLKRFELALELVAHALDLLDREVLLVGAVLEFHQPGFLELVDARRERGLLRRIGHLKFLETAEADDDGIPVARGGLSPEASHRVGVLRRGVREDEQLRVWVELEVVGGPLLGEVVRHDDHRLAGAPQALELVHGGDAGEGLAGADRVRDQRALAVLDDARHGVALVLPELDVGRHARQREVVAAVGARGDAVELPVVDLGEHGRAVLVLPDPLAEGLLQLAALRVGRGRGDRVGDLLLGLARYGVVVGIVLLDLDEAAVERRGENHEAVVGAHAPLLRDRLIHAAAGGRDAPPAGHLGVADLEASRLGGGLVAAAFPALVSVSDLEGLEREVANHRRGDPGTSELTGDLPGHELDRLHGL